MAKRNIINKKTVVNRRIVNPKIKTKFKNEKPKNKKDKRISWQTFIIILIGIVLLSCIVLFSIRAYTHYTELEDHKDYFLQPGAPIQDWMTIHSIVRHYNLTEERIYTELNVSPGTLISELGLDNSTVIDRLTIEKICVEKHLNCTVVVNRLNNIGTN